MLNANGIMCLYNKSKGCKMKIKKNKYSMAFRVMLWTLGLVAVSIVGMIFGFQVTTGFFASIVFAKMSGII